MCDEGCIRKSDIIHTMSSNVYDFIADHAIEQDVEHFCFVVHRQPNLLYSFTKAIAHLEKKPDSSQAYSRIHRIINMCTEALFLFQHRNDATLQDDDHVRFLRSMDQPLEEDIEFGTWHRLNLPFVMPISYMYPFANFVQDVPGTYPVVVRAFYEEKQKTQPHGFVYDPLYLL